MANEQKKGISRRNFLLGAAGVSVVAVAGTGYWAVQQPPLTFIENSYSGSNGKRVLVAYGSQYGSTSGIADAIGQALHEDGANVEVHRITESLSADGYDAAIIGAPVISNEWMPDATSFVDRNATTLANMPVAVFLTGMELALTRDVAGTQERMSALLQTTITPYLQPIEYGLFAGALDYSKMSPAMQGMYRLFSEDDTDGDYRDFAAIRAWASSLTPDLLA